mmetsp:Transcript_10376/g.34080  ORF Transcript_10376/g.34080 Transcript_10376/m.34080 type:complete len:1431 (-) Transcript_10376:1171-5463(-)
MGVKHPESVASITGLRSRSSLPGGLGFEHIPFMLLYAYVLQWCIDTSGQPYAAALRHHELYNAAHPATAPEVLDEWTSGDATAQDDEWGDLELEDTDFVEVAGNATGMENATQVEPEPPVLPNPYLPDFWACLALAGVVIAHALLMFAQHWAVSFKAFVKYQRSDKLEVGAFALVRPHLHQGKSEIVTLKSYQNRDGTKGIFFYFQHQRYECEEIAGGAPDDQRVSEVQCPIDLPLEHYTRSRGIVSEEQVQDALERYGNNSFHIPMPTLKDMYIQQITGPVPVFQIFCTGLWLMDEYWNYALFNMASIFIFEGTTCFGRMKNTSTLRGMKNKATPLQVYRKGGWQELSSEELLPGDIYSLARSSGDERVVPCDSLLLRGSAVVNEATLTGESTPQMKDEVSAEGGAASEALDTQSKDRIHTLFSGTSLMKVSPGDSSSAPGVPGTPDEGCLCYALCTGFSSSQGKLMRMIEHSNEQVMSDAKEVLVLLFILLVFAIAAATYVLRKGLAEGKRSQYELVLRCVMIVTAVVPPELPMQTAVAVNTALLALWRSQVFCTEPFRIPYAGKISACLFDKTGTLTTDKLVLTGMVCTRSKAAGGYELPCQQMDKVEDASPNACLVFGACHSLVEVEGKLAGDPIETAALDAIRWEFKQKSQTASPKPRGAVPEGGGEPKPAGIGPASLRATVLHRYHFSSKLQRMSVLAQVRGGSYGDSPKLFAFVKGSPEIVKTLLKKVPDGYDNSYRYLAEKGMRVLALAQRPLLESEADLARPGRGASERLTRDAVEKNLEFVGFAAFSCLVRRDTPQIISQLLKGSHFVAMATGDAPLTALHVSAEVGITTRSPEDSLMLQEIGETGLEWVSGRCDDSGNPFRKQPYAGPGSIQALAKTKDLCVTGSALRLAVSLDPAVWKEMEHIKVFARMAPEDKEAVLRALNEQGHHTLMCGDGANDVGALKQAHVGIALLAGFGGANTSSAGTTAVQETEEQKKERMQALALKHRERAETVKRERQQEMEELRQKQVIWLKEETDRLTAAGESFATFKAMKAVGVRVIEEQKRLNASRVGRHGGSGLAAEAAMMAMDGDSGEVPMVKLGDASIAAPFTSKFPSVRSCVDIIRQGRCTLVSTIQMQQILALNCLIAAYSLSTLYMDGVRSGEAQMIASGVLLNIAGLSFSYAQPVQELSSSRPLASIFHPALSLSLAGQLAIHLGCMAYAVHLSKLTAPDEEEGPPPTPLIGVAEEELAGKLITPFKPTLLNTVVFLIETAQQVSVLAVNYKGRPSMMAAAENKPLMLSLLGCGVGAFVCAFEVIPYLNQRLQLVPLPGTEFKLQLLGMLFASVLGAFVWDRLMLFIFARDLFWTSFFDNIKAIPQLIVFGPTSRKVLFYGGVIGLYLATDCNPVVLLMGWWLNRKINPPATPARAPPARPPPSTVRQ